MSRRKLTEPGRTAAGLLATGLVLLGGITSCAAIVLSFSQNATRGLLFVAAIFFAAAFAAFVLSDRRAGPAQLMAALFKPRKRPDEVRYRVRRRKRRGAAEPIQPPTAETVRDLTDSPNAWVPTGRPRP
jgi:di/tricarboxylate transporter